MSDNTCELHLRGDKPHPAGNCKAGQEIELHGRGKIREAKTEMKDQGKETGGPMDMAGAVMGKGKGKQHYTRLMIDLHHTQVTPARKKTPTSAAAPKTAADAVLANRT